MLNKLRDKCIEISPFCAGIDIKIDQVPDSIKAKHDSDIEAILEYGKMCIDAAIGHAAAFKFQIACYEAYGIRGMEVYSQLLQYAREKGQICIADIKRGDIGSTAEMYAKGHLSGDFEADIVTLNAYMGSDAVTPFFDYFRNHNKAAFVLGKTSNPSSVDLQDIKVGDEYIYGYALKNIEKLGEKVGVEGRFKPVGAVVAVNHASDLDYLREKTANIFMLIPGYGHQGAKIEDIKKLVFDNKNGIVNVSRGYTKGHNEVEDVFASLAERAEKLSKELVFCIK